MSSWPRRNVRRQNTHNLGLVAFVDLISALTLDGRFDVIVYVIQGTDLQRLHEEIIVNVEPSPRVKFFLSVQDATSMFEILSQATYCVNYKLHASVMCFTHTFARSELH